MALADSFLAIFRGNPTAHCTLNKGDYISLEREITLADVERHLAGNLPSLLSIPINREGNCHFGAIDWDRHGKEDPPLPPIDIEATARKVTELGLPLIVCASKSGKGVHFYLFLKEKDGFPATTIKQLLDKYRRVLQLDGLVEIFPKQDALEEKTDKDGKPTGEWEMGNGINLPYFGESRIAYGPDGEPLDVAGFLALVEQRKAFGSILATRDLTDATGASGHRDSSEEKFDRPMLEIRIREIHAENLKALHDSNMVGGWNSAANKAAFWAGRAFAGKALEGTEESIKRELLKSAAPIDGKNEDIAKKTLASGWNSGIAEPLKVLPVAVASVIDKPDMPESVLDGYLGNVVREHMREFPIAYAWPSVLSAASVIVQPHPTIRMNLFGCLVGPPHSAKSQAQQRANFLFCLKELELLETEKCGSGEGLAEKIGDRQGKPVLWSPDELSHLLEKAQIEHSSFSFVLNTVFYEDENSITVAKRKHVKLHARISLTGGVVEENFGDSFGSQSTAGLYDRFLFGVCPSGFDYKYYPMEDEPLFKVTHVPGDDLFHPVPRIGYNIVTPKIDPDVWAARNEIQKDERIEPRVLEICIRVALICAAWDRKLMLRASDLKPHWELARYQTRARRLLQPNPGLNFEAMAANKVLSFVTANADGDKWLSWREVQKRTKVAEKYGPSIVERAINAMVFSGEIEEVFAKPTGGGRAKRLVRLPVAA